MSNDSKYPAEFVVMTEKRPNGIAWGIRDEHGKSYDLADVERIWFEADAEDVCIDTNLTFIRLVERNFDPVAFDEYLNNR